MSYTIDTTLSPLYVLHFYDDLSLEETKRFFAEVDTLLTRSGKFGVVMSYNLEEEHDHDEEFDEDFDLKEEDDDEHDRKHGHEPGVARFQKAWLVANRDRFAQDCVGIAMVNSDSKFVSFYAPLANKIMSRMYRCPGAMFGDENKALAWVQARMPQLAD